jgi:hypothetical protein
MSSQEQATTPEDFDRLKPAEKQLVKQRPHAPWTMPLIERRPGDPYGGPTGFMAKLKCRFCIALDGSAPTVDIARVGFTSETQFLEHLEEHHMTGDTQ